MPDPLRAKALQYVTTRNGLLPPVTRAQAIEHNIRAAQTVDQLEGIRQWIENSGRDYGTLWNWHNDHLTRLWEYRYAIIHPAPKMHTSKYANQKTNTPAVELPIPRD